MRILRSHITPQFEKDFSLSPSFIRKKAKQKIKLFEENCFLPVLHTHKLKGILAKFWSFNVNDDYRMIFRFLPKQEVIYYRIGPHKVYQELERL